MRKNKLTKAHLILYGIGCVIVGYVAILLAPGLENGLEGLLLGLNDITSHPFRLKWCETTPKVLLLFLVVYIICILLYVTSGKNYRRGEEHGSAKWGDANAICKKYQAKAEDLPGKTEREVLLQNKILTQNVRIGLNNRAHRRNLNILTIGGSGAGKTFFFAKPNVMNCASSYIVLDPKGEILADTGYLLEEQGYEVKVLNLINMEESYHYNPFWYIPNDDSADTVIQTIVTNFYKNTTPKGSNSADPFWDQAGAMLLKALISYLHYAVVKEEQTFATIVDLLTLVQIDEEHPEKENPLDVAFNEFAERDPTNPCIIYYSLFRKGAGKTIKSVIITLVARLEKFTIPQLQKLTSFDEMELEKIGERKTALFCVTPDSDNSFNFIVGMLYTQLFQKLYYSADFVHGGRLPVHVHFVMDEFSNVALPDDFASLISTMRSREISVSIILQNLQQLKKLFEKEWQSIVGNCDELLFLGCNEEETCEYITKLLGKETIDVDSYGKSRGSHGSFSTNSQVTGRELMQANEVRTLDNDLALLFIRGEDPVKDKKYNIFNHPYFSKTMSGGAKRYVATAPKHIFNGHLETIDLKIDMVEYIKGAEE